MKKQNLTKFIKRDIEKINLLMPEHLSANQIVEKDNLEEFETIFNKFDNFLLNKKINYSKEKILSFSYYLYVNDRLISFLPGILLAEKKYYDDENSIIELAEGILNNRPIKILESNVEALQILFSNIIINIKENHEYILKIYASMQFSTTSENFTSIDTEINKLKENKNIEILCALEKYKQFSVSLRFMNIAIIRFFSVF